MIDKKGYNDIEIPENLSTLVDEAIVRGLSKKKHTHKIFVKVISYAAIFCLSFVTLLNTVPTFVSAMYEIPVVGKMCRIFTFREYHFEDAIKYVDVKIPHINNTGKNELETRVNLEISKLIAEEVEKGENRAKEYYDAYVQTGGDPSEFMMIGINVDYEIKSMNDKNVSFVITTSESSASYYSQQYFYNMDLQSGKLFDLQDWFGPNYKEIVTASIQETISQFSEEEKSNLFEDINIGDLITENRNFYLNDKNQIVIVFEKYEIAVGANGIMEFAIDESVE